MTINGSRLQDGGDYNFSYFLKPIILSFIFAHFLSLIIKYIFLSERNLLEIKKEKKLDKSIEKIDKVKRIIIIKYIIFFVVGVLLLIFFWYYLSSFGAVYHNSQKYLLKNTIFSFIISLLYPFIINLLPGIFRVNSLKDTNKSKECLYKISKLIQFI